MMQRRILKKELWGNMNKSNENIKYFGVGRPKLEHERQVINWWMVFRFFMRILEILFVMVIVSLIVIVVFDL